MKKYNLAMNYHVIRGGANSNNRQAVENAPENAVERARQVSLILENTTDAYVAVDREWRYTYVNAQAERISGIRREDILGKTVRQVFPNGIGTISMPEFRRAMEERVAVEFTDFIEEFGAWLEMRAFPTDHGIAIYARDVSERVRHDAVLRQEQESLRLSEMRLAEAQRIAHVGSWEIDAATGAVTWSQELFRITGLDPASGIPNSARIRALYHPDDAPRRDMLLADILATGQPWDMESRFIRPDGEFGWWHVTARAVLDSSGNVVRVMGTAADITDRVMSERSLRESSDRLIESEKRLRTALTGGWLGWWHLDMLTGNYIEFSDQCKAHFGLPTDAQICLDDFLSLVHHEDRAMLDAATEQALSSQSDFAAEYRVIWSDGSIHWVSAHATIIRDETGLAVRAIGTTQDITERKMAEDTLRERTEVLESVLATIPHQVFWKDRNSVYLGCNGPFARSAGVSDPREIIGKHDSDLAFTVEEADAHRKADQRVLEGGNPIIDVEETHRYTDGSSTVGLKSKLPLHDGRGHVVGIVGITHDITDRKALEAERERLLADTERLLAEARDRADRDPLTNLLNHRAFHSRLKDETARAKREGTTFAVAVLDLDNFKFFNDVYGHGVGDDVLRMVAERLQQTCRTYDIVARFGGDEFAVIMPNVQPSSAMEVETRVSEAMRNLAYQPDGPVPAIPITVSVGTALLSREGQDWHEVLQLADERLLRVKSGGDTETEADRLRAYAAGTVAGFSMLDALVAAVDNKDRYTRRHSEDVLSYSLMIARELGMSEAEQRLVGVAALLHDVGKIGVPDAILRKPGKLTDEEYDAIKQHPQMGAIMVTAVPGLEGILEAVRHHHERWDGDGYPFGLRETETPLIARLMAVADAYSAMTTDRPYRKGMPSVKALEILECGAGAQWDSRCVEAFARAMKQ